MTNPPASHSFPGVATLADQLVGVGYRVKALCRRTCLPSPQAGRRRITRCTPLSTWVYFPTTKMPIADASAHGRPTRRLSSARPDFVWYTPNLINDEHDGTVQDGDAFLARFIPGVQATSWYKAGGRIIIEWDESDGDNSGHQPQDRRGPHTDDRGVGQGV